MADEVLSAAIGATAALVGAFLTGVFDTFRQYRIRPILELDFREQNDAYCVESSYKVDDQLRTSTFIRVRLVNTGKSVARDCRVFLTKIEEIDGTRIHPTKLYDAKELPWAGYPSDYNSRPIPVGINSYIDVLRISKDDPTWHFRVKALFASQESIKTYSGTFRVKVLATADNAAPVECEFEVTFNGQYQTLRTSFIG